MGQIGTDVAAFEKELVAAGAAFHENGFACIRIARAAAQRGFDFRKPLLKISRRHGVIGFREKPGGEFAHWSIRVRSQTISDFGGYDRETNLAGLQRLQQGLTPFRAAR